MERRNLSRITAIIITFVVIALAAFFGIQLITKTGIFTDPKPAGQIVFDPSVTEELRNFISDNLPADLELATDVVISSDRSQTAPTSSPNTVIYDVLLPTADFYDPRQSISSSDLGDTLASDNPSVTLISINNLEPIRKVLAIDDEYYFDNFDRGAIFAYLTFTDQPAPASNATNSSETVTITPASAVANLVQQALDPLPAKDDILTLAQTGVTALSRNMTSKLAEVGDASYFAANIAPFLSRFDYAHTSNEASFTDAATPSNICSKPTMLDVLTTSGINIVELTGNHNLDCGAEAAISTIDTYHSHNIQTFGGGKSATDAATPLELSTKDTTITLLGYNESTGGATTGDTPGANLYTLEKATADINAAKSAGNFVIVDVQFYECNSYDDPSENTTCDYANSSAGDQIGTFRTLIDLGTDIVVGTSAHQPQTFELYKNGAIYYGLGNLFFDQAWWPGTTRSLVLVHYFYKNHHLQTRIIPTVYDTNFQTSLMDPASAEAFLSRLISARPQ